MPAVVSAVYDFFSALNKLVGHENYLFSFKERLYLRTKEKNIFNEQLSPITVNGGSGQQNTRVELKQISFCTLKHVHGRSGDECPDGMV